MQIFIAVSNAVLYRAMRCDEIKCDAGGIWGSGIILMICLAELEKAELVFEGSSLQMQAPNGRRVIGHDLGVGRINTFPANQAALAPDYLVGFADLQLHQPSPTLTIGLYASNSPLAIGILSSSSFF